MTLASVINLLVQALDSSACTATEARSKPKGSALIEVALKSPRD
jgi:hypothetical protein